MKYKCTECLKVTTFTPIGPYRSQCDECGALLKNEELKESKDAPR
jgi:hypothetical protein